MCPSEMKELGLFKAALVLVHDEQPEHFCSSYLKKEQRQEGFYLFKILKYAVETWQTYLKQSIKQTAIWQDEVRMHLALAT